MTIPADKVMLYAATEIDLQMALGAAAAAGIPAANVTGDFTNAWTHVAKSGMLVIAVGRAALNALYFNPCHWSNPANQPGGHTPFDVRGGPTASIPGAGYFVNGAGHLAQDTYKLATMLACYAVHGKYPAGMETAPAAIAPAELCDSRADVNVPCPC